MAETNIEDFVSVLMTFVSWETRRFSRPKKQAVDRYMRTFLRALTRFELEMAIRFHETNGFLDPDLAFKIDQASKGYDRYMSRRSRR